MKKLVSILVPCYNEEASLPQLYKEVCRLMDTEPACEWELFFIDDGSRDRTMEIIRQLAQEDGRVAYVGLSRNFGKENAMLAGFDHVAGDCMVIMDADLQHPPALIPEMLRLWEQGYEDVYARRNSRGKESALRRGLSMAFYRILSKSARYEVLENVGDFRLLDRKCINALRSLRETERYTKGMYSWIGFRKTEVTFDTNDRIAGVSKWSYSSLLNLAIEGITSFTTAPLRMATLMGFTVAIGALSYMIYVIVKAILWGEPVSGYPTIMTVMLFLGAVQLIAIGILGEYVGRIFNETKQRPVYVISQLKEREDISHQKERED